MIDFFGLLPGKLTCPPQNQWLEDEFSIIFLLKVRPFSGVIRSFSGVYHHCLASLSGRTRTFPKRDLQIYSWCHSKNCQTAWMAETNIFAPKNGWLEYDPFLLGRPIFRGELLVSGRVEVR